MDSKSANISIDVTNMFVQKNSSNLLSPVKLRLEKSANTRPQRSLSDVTESMTKAESLRQVQSHNL
jgi:hypothetical protein